jgi:hypothetical protein
LYQDKESKNKGFPSAATKNPAFAGSFCCSVRARTWTFLIQINDQDYWQGEKKSVDLNLENKRIFEKAWDDPFLETLIETDNYYPGSLFAISEAVKNIRQIDGRERG